MVLLPTLGKPTIPQFNGTGTFLFSPLNMERVPMKSNHVRFQCIICLILGTLPVSRSPKQSEACRDTLGLRGLQAFHFPSAANSEKSHRTMLTDNEIRRYDSPKNWPRKRLLLTDRGGLALDVLPSGVRSWVFRYRSKAGVRCKLTIARYPDLSLRGAREERDKLAAEVARGLPDRAHAADDGHQRDRLKNARRRRGPPQAPLEGDKQDDAIRQLSLVMEQHLKPLKSTKTC
jgi:hypothetical protein